MSEEVTQQGKLMYEEMYEGIRFRVIAKDFDGPIYCICRGNQGEIYASGDFTRVNDLKLNGHGIVRVNPDGGIEVIVRGSDKPIYCICPGNQGEIYAALSVYNTPTIVRVDPNGQTERIVMFSYPVWSICQGNQGEIYAAVPARVYKGYSMAVDIGYDILRINPSSKKLVERIVEGFGSPIYCICQGNQGEIYAALSLGNAPTIGRVNPNGGIEVIAKDFDGPVSSIFPGNQGEIYAAVTGYLTRVNFLKIRDDVIVRVDPNGQTERIVEGFDIRFEYICPGDQEEICAAGYFGRGYFGRGMRGLRGLELINGYGIVGVKPKK